MKDESNSFKLHLNGFYITDFVEIVTL